MLAKEKTCFSTIAETDIEETDAYIKSKFWKWVEKAVAEGEIRVTTTQPPPRCSFPDITRPEFHDQVATNDFKYIIYFSLCSLLLLIS